MIFCEDCTQLNHIAHLIQTKMNLLATYDEPRKAPTQRGGPARLPAQCRGVVWKSPIGKQAVYCATLSFNAKVDLVNF